MLINDVRIPRMFGVYMTILRSYYPEELMFYHAECGGSFKMPDVRSGIFHNTRTHCPKCGAPIRFGECDHDTLYVPQGYIVPLDMYLRLDVYNDVVRLTVRGNGLTTYADDTPQASRQYWEQTRYHEVFRFDIQHRRTTWRRYSCGREAQRIELGDPCELPRLGRFSVLRYLYAHFSVRDRKSAVTDLLKDLREAVRKKLACRLKHPVSHMFCTSGRSSGWLLLPIGNIAYRMIFTDAPNLSPIWRALNTAQIQAVIDSHTFPENFDFDVLRKAKSTVAGLIEAGGLPNTRSIRRVLTEDPFDVGILVLLHRIFDKPDSLMAAYRRCCHIIAGNRNSDGVYGYYGISVNRLLEYLCVQVQILRPIYTDRDLLRLLGEPRMMILQDTFRMLNQAGDATLEMLRRHPPRIRDLHDWLVERLRIESRPDYTFDNALDPIRRRLAMQADRVTFFLPEHSSVLYEAGDTLHNCVGTYARRVRDGETSIVLMTDDRGKLTACIEVKGGAIIQAKIDRNRPVHERPEVNSEIIAWAKQTGVSYINCSDVKEPTPATENEIIAAAV
jgi:hypothetical protein|nr:MAG TPA: PcfJ like protein [Caudoviricetes sp.]